MKEAARVYAALGQPTRLAILRALAAGPCAVGVIGAAVGLAPSTLSFHLRALVEAGLVSTSARGRSIECRIERAALERAAALLATLALDGAPPTPDVGDPSMQPRLLNVLFLCTGNSARSILAEVLLNHLGRGRFRAFSAGSHPVGQVNPLALELIADMGLSTDGLRSKDWGEFARADAPALDMVFTVCDNAAGEVCPAWPGQPMTAHWGIDDPAAATGTLAERRRAFTRAATHLRNRILLFTQLPFASLDALALKRNLDEIGQLPLDAPLPVDAAERAALGALAESRRRGTNEPVQE